MKWNSYIVKIYIYIKRIHKHANILKAIHIYTLSETTIYATNSIHICICLFHLSSDGNLAVLYENCLIRSNCLIQYAEWFDFFIVLILHSELSNDHIHLNHLVSYPFQWIENMITSNHQLQLQLALKMLNKIHVSFSFTRALHSVQCKMHICIRDYNSFHSKWKLLVFEFSSNACSLIQLHTL